MSLRDTSESLPLTTHDSQLDAKQNNATEAERVAL
jgi:hypothetical protein